MWHGGDGAPSANEAQQTFLSREVAVIQSDQSAQPTAPVAPNCTSQHQTSTEPNRTDNVIGPQQRDNPEGSLDSSRTSTACSFTLCTREHPKYQTGRHEADLSPRCQQRQTVARGWLYIQDQFLRFKIKAYYVQESRDHVVQSDTVDADHEDHGILLTRRIENVDTQFVDGAATVVAAAAALAAYESGSFTGLGASTGTGVASGFSLLALSALPSD